MNNTILIEHDTFTPNLIRYIISIILHLFLLHFKILQNCKYQLLLTIDKIFNRNYELSKKYYLYNPLIENLQK